MLKAEDVKVGMRVKSEDLWEIIGVAFLLTDFDEEGYGTVVYAGKPYTKELRDLSVSLVAQGKPICNLYEPYDGEEVSWDE